MLPPAVRYQRPIIAEPLDLERPFAIWPSSIRISGHLEPGTVQLSAIAYPPAQYALTPVVLIVNSQRQQEETLAMLFKMPSRYRVHVVRGYQYEPAVSQLAARDVSAARHVIDDFERQKMQSFLETRYRFFQVANDEVDVMNSLGRHIASSSAQAA